MKILVVLANFGHANDAHMARMLKEYRSLEHSVDLVVTSNIPRDLGPDVEVIVGLPENNPFALPFAHKKIFAERCERYDLFIYSEDDILITRDNIDAFLAATAVLPEPKLAGFVRCEIDAGGNRYYDPLLSCFHWVPSSVARYGKYTCAFFTNQHSGCYMLTREQLRKAIASGGFLVRPHENRYELREAAATDPYTQCGFEELLCVSHLDKFTVQHLPANKYSTRPYRASREFHLQLDALLSLEAKRMPTDLLFEPETRLLYGKWSKDYYEPANQAAISLIPAGTRTVLSIGCAWGATEATLVKNGVRVTAIPMDSVIAACAENKGVEIVYGGFESARRMLRGWKFDCLLFSNVLQFVPDPVAVLAMFREFLTPSGSVIAVAPNFAQITSRWRRLIGREPYRSLGDYSKTGLHVTTPRLLRRWFCEAGIRPVQCVYAIPEKGERTHRWSNGLMDSLLGEDMICLGVGAEAMPARANWHVEERDEKPEPDAERVEKALV